jgi:hypothetical protein
MIQRKNLLKFVTLISSFVLIFATTSSPVFANSWNKSNLPQKSTYTGFWMQGTIPTMNSNWTSGTLNKINYEYWFNIDNDNSKWVEMGYHDGAWYDSLGYISSYIYYHGLFTLKWQGSGTLQVDAYPNLGWNPGQNHTTGNQLTYNSSASRWDCSMRADGATIKTYTNVGPSRLGTIDAGLEWNTSNNASQSVSLPCSIYNLNVYDSSTWKTWNTAGSPTNSNDPTGVKATYNSSTNTINFTKS